MPKQQKKQDLERKARSEATLRHFRQAREHRTAIASDFRARLREELGTQPLPASRLAVLEAAVGCHTELTILNERFCRGRELPRAAERACILRGTLLRLLRALGLISRDAADADAATPAERLAAFQRELEEMPDDES